MVKMIVVCTQDHKATGGRWRFIVNDLIALDLESMLCAFEFHGFFIRTEIYN